MLCRAGLGFVLVHGLILDGVPVRDLLDDRVDGVGGQRRELVAGDNPLTLRPIIVRNDCSEAQLGCVMWRYYWLEKLSIISSFIIDGEGEDADG